MSSDVRDYGFGKMVFKKLEYFQVGVCTQPPEILFFQWFFSRSAIKKNAMKYLLRQIDTKPWFVVSPVLTDHFLFIKIIK